MFTLTSAKLTGSPGASGWSQVHDFTPEDTEKLKLRGHLFAVVSSSIPGRELISRLHEEYFGETQTSAYQALKKAVETVISESHASWGEVEIAAVSVLEDVVYSAAAGGAEIAIFRNGMLAKILVSSKGAVVSASGYPKEGDLLIACTKAFFGTLRGDVVKSALSSLDPESTVETLAPGVHTREDAGNLGTVIIKFSTTEDFGKETKPSPVSLQKTLARVTGLVSSLLPPRKIYIKEGPEEELMTQRRKVTASIGVILLILLLVSIGFGVRQRGIRLSKARYESRLSAAQHEFDEAISLSSLNPDRARELFVSSMKMVDELENEKVSDPALSLLKKRIEENEGPILGEYRANPEPFIDLSLLSSGFKGDNMASSSEKVLVLDKKGGKVVGIRVSTKKSEVIAGPDQIQDALGLATYEDRVFILTSSGIYEVGDTKTKVVNADWEGGVLIYAYAGNLYVLDKKQIWRYPAEGKTFGSKQSWLASSIKLDFSGAKVWTIDGAIYIILPPARILKFSLGSPQSFNVSGVSPDLSSIDSIYSNEDLKGIYILDKAGKRIVVFDKDGGYKAQYVSDKIGEASDLVVSEKERKIILLAGSKLYSIEIKHL